MGEAYICDAVRTPIGRYGGALSSVRADDLGAVPIAALLARQGNLDPASIEDVVYGCANQAGEDNRNVGRMSALLAGLPVTVPASTVNRLCGSGMNAIGNVADAIRAGGIGLAIAGGVESMSRAPFVMAKQTAAFGRNAEIYDTTLGWRFVNRKLEEQYGIDSMAETAENVADEFNVSREDQDEFALRSQRRAEAAIGSGVLAEEIVPVTVPQRRGDPVVVDTDEHPRSGSTIEGLAKLKPIVRSGGKVTAGNASGINDGACALLVVSGDAAGRLGLEPLARVVAWAAVGVEPRIMGIGPAPASEKALALAGLDISRMDVIELNEAFAAQGLATLRTLGVDDAAEHVNPNGGAIALGHPLGMSGARLVTTAAYELRRRNGRYALCTMCIGVGQGIAMVIERP
ncbi:MAG: 3-oxoadipyl-CoA thiolase [Gammaproteobacteria bacterium]|jgi:3-oxoadipyl-CoA thiolase|nr:3-oxoadipyl-CoA thiolase [Gammaproteobacteria bacterium]MDH3756684.1 3-oxoadipyl-CoA thiolase [Gammaproteobacteria bacterium]MDH3846291.1 3-oxoadipyl-CoA thiolase [Gammaproteobacteria bacterium]MDH3864417.1 3-oxoadipyl-CoA thiolase [Gammaproteobacteria bacterium]MDH3904884.1 3-oxoadipyl-CoA thiolase [Gammaproteobacteria bacterium]